MFGCCNPAAVSGPDCAAMLIAFDVQISLATDVPIGKEKVYCERTVLCCLMYLPVTC